MLLLSGGIDGPVAAWMMAKGVKVEAVHFYSYPYTSEDLKRRLLILPGYLAYCLGMNLYIVPFTEIQEQIAEKCPHDQLTIIMRRIMMSIAEKLAVKSGPFTGNRKVGTSKAKQWKASMLPILL